MLTPYKTKAFHFKQFRIHAGYSGMPVSTDAVLLGAWALPQGGQHLLDIGTGSGILALMCAQRFAQTQITALELDWDAFYSARYNFQCSPWFTRLKLLHQDLRYFTTTTRFDGIICNPPYFSQGQQAQDPARAKARHWDALPHHKLLTQCRALLTPQGKASFILPSKEAQSMISIALNQGWFLARCCQVRTKPNKAVTRYLFELQTRACETEHSHLCINHELTGYSPQFIALTKDFYLNLG